MVHNLPAFQLDALIVILRANLELNKLLIIESVDSISRDGPDTPIYAIHYKKPKNSDQFDFSVF